VRRLRVLTPTFRPVGGVVKIFDYALHAQTLGLEPIIYCPEPANQNLHLFQIEHLSALFESLRFEDQRALRIEHGDLVLFSWPMEYDLVAARAAGNISPSQVIHLVQNTRHGNPLWLRGYASRLLTRPLSRIMVAEQVRQACEQFLNKRSLTTTIVEGHNWEYFALERSGELHHPIRVGYTTWKSDLGCRVESQLEGSSDFQFRHIADTVGWSELRDLYRWCDVFLATPGPQEGFYLPGLEAMAAGSIVLTPDAGGNMEYCHFDENCIGVELEQEDSYVDALVRLGEMSVDDVASLRRSAYSTLERHTLTSERESFSRFLAGVEDSLVNLSAPAPGSIGPESNGPSSNQGKTVVSYLEELLTSSEEAEVEKIDADEVRDRFGIRAVSATDGRFPDFLGIGAQKAGTTWLHRSLATHPDVWVPSEKELHYFDEKYVRSASIRRPPVGDDVESERWRRQMRRQLLSYRDRDPDQSELAWALTYFLEPPSDEWYARLFQRRRANQVAGEFTPDYSTLPIETIRHIYEIMPGGKIIFFVRNPIERAWSQAAMTARMNHGRQQLSEDEIESHLLSANSRRLTDYTGTIDRWTSVFPPDQFFLGFIEDISFFPARLLGRLYRFLRVSDNEDRYRVFRRKVHSGDTDSISAPGAYLLAKTYLPLMEELDRRLGGYVSGWLHVARSILDRGPEGPDLPYPLWHWESWREWAGLTEGQEPDRTTSEGIRLQSERLE